MLGGVGLELSQDTVVSRVDWGLVRDGVLGRVYLYYFYTQQKQLVRNYMNL